MPNERFVQVIYRISESQRRELKILAAQQDISTTELVRRVFDRYLTEHKAKQAA